MTIPTADIHDCPEHGLFANPNYWPCPFCYHRPHIQVGPMVWNTAWVTWKGEERLLTLDYVETDDPKWQHGIIFSRPLNP